MIWFNSEYKFEHMRIVCMLWYKVANISQAKAFDLRQIYEIN